MAAEVVAPSQQMPNGVEATTNGDASTTNGAANGHATVTFDTYRGTKQGKIVKATAQRSVGPDEVLVEITHSGLCATEMHVRHVDMALGHEGVGIVKQIGPLVKTLKVGDRVGWGFLHEACNNCKQCLTGGEIYCPDRKMFSFANLDQGSLGTHAVWKPDFLFKIPDAMSSADAAPMMCAGATVFGALQQNGYKSTDRVGVIGVGGLGHLAIQFAVKMGMEVVAFSHTEAKRQDALNFGASEFYVTDGVEKFEGIRPIDHLLACGTVQPDYSLFFPIMEPRGTIYPLTAFDKDFVSAPHLGLIFQGVRIQGSMIATKQGYRDMLEFAVQHKIKSVNQEFPMTLEGINEALAALETGKMRYRGVLVV